MVFLLFCGLIGDLWSGEGIEDLISRFKSCGAGVNYVLSAKVEINEKTIIDFGILRSGGAPLPVAHHFYP
jgi:hypothetical protein